MQLSVRRLLSLVCLTTVSATTFAALGEAAQLAPIEELGPFPTPVPSVPLPAVTPTSKPAPALTTLRGQAYIATEGGPARLIGGRTYVPATFFSNGVGASIGPVNKTGQWRLLFFDRDVTFHPDQVGIRVNGAYQRLSEPPKLVNGQLYLPLVAFAKILGLKWSLAPGYNPKTDTQKTVFLVQYPAATITNVESRVEKERVRTVITLSNPTRVVAKLGDQNATFEFAGVREAGIPTVQTVGDALVPRTTLTSGGGAAKFEMPLNYRAPLRWFTTGNPARIVIDASRIFEEQSSSFSGGVKITRIRRGIGRGPVQMYAAMVDPRDGWRVRLGTGDSVLQRTRTSRLAARAKAPLAVNGGFFAWDGAAVGAVLQRGQWIRLPWKGRTAVGFTANGRAHIAPLQVNAQAYFSSGLRVPFRDLNGWPDKNRVTALTRHFGAYYKLRPGEIAVVVENGIVTSTPGGGGFNIPQNGWALVANGGAVPILRQVRKGLRARKVVQPIGWPQGLVTALGGGPRLVKNGQISVGDEGFRSDVLSGAGPRTAFGIDKQGRYILLVVDGRRSNHSVGLTLHELAATMQRLGAVDALNLDGGGSAAMVVRGQVINRPSDGRERGVSNALLVTR